jgi:hypothetical protein
MSAGQNPNCIGCERSFCYLSTSTGPQRLVIVTRSHLRVGKAPNCGSFGPPSGLPVFGRIKARASKPVSYSRRFTAGSTKVLTRLSCKTPRSCSTSWRDAIHSVGQPKQLPATEMRQSTDRHIGKSLRYGRIGEIARLRAQPRYRETPAPYLPASAPRKAKREPVTDPNGLFSRPLLLLSRNSHAGRV